ncbi:hypothetical protein PR048_001364 [Dryococelus australis]|uniref:Uncharacterized protein n=1 Tax=Dryococelus australis TaxID=614101 RepID=A0ABQ9IH61_9NEOP|nr:hypothetical protein PR048_001364 [Dryococelus australis]
MFYSPSTTLVEGNEDKKKRYAIDAVKSDTDYGSSADHLPEDLSEKELVKKCGTFVALMQSRTGEDRRASKHGTTRHGEGDVATLSAGLGAHLSTHAGLRIITPASHPSAN